MLFTPLFYIFIASVAIQLCYYLFLFRKFAYAHQPKTTPNTFGVSVVICAKNEAENLKANLEAVLTQEYPNFEVIVVNDATDDHSLSVLKNFKKRYQHLKIIDIATTPTYTGNKKNALATGIKAANNNYLLLTDADCKPVSKYWISSMTSKFTKEKKIVLGYGAYQKIGHSFLNKLIRFETLLTAVQYFSYATSGLPYMGVGRNLAYTKTSFTAAGGFSTHTHIDSGDDDLLIHQIATKHNTACCFSKESFTISEPKKNLKAWFRQKRRHITTASHYKPIIQFLLSLFYLSQFIFWVAAIILLAFSFKWQPVTILIIIRLITQYIILGSSARKLYEKDLILFFPVLDVTLVVLQLSLYIRNAISKPTTW